MMVIILKEKYSNGRAESGEINPNWEILKRPLNKAGIKRTLIN